MTTLSIITGTIGAFTSIVAFTIVITWLVDTKGVLLKSSVGRSMAYFLTVTGIISMTSVFTSFFPSYHLLSVAHAISMLLFASAVAMFGYSRSKIQRSARRAERNRKETTHG